MDADAVLLVRAPALPDVEVPAAEVVAPDRTVVVVDVGSVPSVERFATVEEAVRALAHVTRYSAWRRGSPGTVPVLSDVDVKAAADVVAERGPAAALLAAYGVEVLPEAPARTLKSVTAAGTRLGYPVVVKSAAAGLRHRLDLGAVRLDLADRGALRAAYQEISQRFGPEVVVQPMVAPGVACVVEVVDDPVFGPVVGFGLGGIASDLLGDRAWRSAPLTDAGARAILDAPRSAALLHGYRGAPAVDRETLADLLLRVSQLADEQPQVKRLLLNPVLAHPSGLSVVHAEVEYGPAGSRPDTGPRRLR